MIFYLFWNNSVSGHSAAAETANNGVCYKVAGSAKSWTVKYISCADKRSAGGRVGCATVGVRLARLAHNSAIIIIVAVAREALVKAYTHIVLVCILRLNWYLTRFGAGRILQIANGRILRRLAGGIEAIAVPLNTLASRTRRA